MENCIHFQQENVPDGYEKHWESSKSIRNHYSDSSDPERLKLPHHEQTSHYHTKRVLHLYLIACFSSLGSVSRVGCTFYEWGREGKGLSFSFSYPSPIPTHSATRPGMHCETAVSPNRGVSSNNGPCPFESFERCGSAHAWERRRARTHHDGGHDAAPSRYLILLLFIP
jgi:hypothetical protein